MASTNGTNGTALPTKQKAAQFHPKDKSVHINEVPVSVATNTSLQKAAHANGDAGPIH
jgi:hypothetical protein